LDGTKTVQDIAHAASQVFDVDIGVAERDVATAIGGMRDQQLLQEEYGGKPERGKG